VTPAERAFWDRAQRRAASMTPEIRAVILRAFQIIRESLSVAELARIVESGNVDLLLREALSGAVMDRAMIPLRQRIRENVGSHVKYFTNDLPRGGKVDGVVAVSFDVLNPKVIEGIRTLDTKVIDRLKTDARDSVRAFVENGIRDGENPRVIARRIREVVGLAPNQEEAVRNYRRALEGKEGARSPTAYKLRDRRFDRFDGKEMNAARIDKAVEAYRKRFVAWNAETNARTASLDAMKLGQRLSWQEAADKGVVDGTKLTKTWRGVKDDRERPEHLAMEGETVPFDSPFSNGEMVPGDSTFNCRCVSIVRVGRS
jgi:hypothetical protein